MRRRAGCLARAVGESWPCLSVQQGNQQPTTSGHGYVLKYSSFCSVFVSVGQLAVSSCALDPLFSKLAVKKWLIARESA